MEFYYLFIIKIVILSASCKAFTIISDSTKEDNPKSLNLAKREISHKPDLGVNHEADKVQLPKYSLYLIGFTMLLMLIAIIWLAVKLYFALKNKSVFGINDNNKQYVRQESTGVTPLYSSNYEEKNMNNGSTLTVNSGIIEISEPRISDPVTPTRIEDSKIIFARKPLRPTVPVMHRGQMDAICKEVLRKVQKSDSASFRDLNELLNIKSEDKSESKCDIVKESEKEVKDEEKVVEKIETQEPKRETKPDINKTIQNEIIMEFKNKTKHESSNETTKETESKLLPDVNKDVQIEINNAVGDKNTEDNDSETEYDTVPTPIRYRHSGPEAEEYENDDIPLYDLPPRRSYDGHPRNVIQMDQDTHYLMPLSVQTTDSCYINAKRHSYKS